MRLSVRVLVLGALVLGLVGAAPSGAAPTGASPVGTLRGPAGTWVGVTVLHEVVLGAQLPEVKELTATRGGFVGFALVSSAQSEALTYVTGNHPQRGCTWGAGCDSWDWPNANGMMRQEDGSHVVPAGRYRFVLLGTPGATVSLKSTFSFLSRVRTTAVRGRMVAQDLVSTIPPVGDQQPHADGAASYEGSSASVTGVVFRLDTDLAKEASADLCVGGSTLSGPLVQICDMSNGGASEGAGVLYYDCSQPVPGVLCLPASTTPDSVTHGLAALVRGGARASFDLSVKAGRSRTYGWAFSFRF
ncbi:MAG TPA: hypothetical protein VM097_08225 [Mycobacteriales bacterium]|nr:hypothetical protein [Mycobacteriales bacterium]